MLFNRMEQKNSRIKFGQLAIYWKVTLHRWLFQKISETQLYFCHLVKEVLLNIKTQRRNISFGKGRLLITAFITRLTHAVTK